MSFINENKLIFGAVGIAISSAAVGYAVSHFLDRRRANAAGKGTKFQAVTTTATVDYFMKYGIRESPPLSKLREVRTVEPLLRCRVSVKLIELNCNLSLIFGSILIDD